MIHTRLCDLLGIAHPILNAPMGGTATATLAAAVSNAGGFGMIGGTSGGGPDWLRGQIRAARGLTERPFGVGLVSSFPNIDDLVQVALDEQVAVINHSFADPTPYVAAAKARGVRVFAQVQSLAQAKRAAQAGVDAIIAQGTEAGGHTGMASTLTLLPAVVDSVGDIPVLAAGGVVDGRGLAAVLLLGASGVSLGTRFVASDEWGGGAWEQQAVLAASTDDTIRTSVYDQVRGASFPAGIADRVLRNRFNTTWDGRMAEIREQQAALRQELEAGAKAQDKEVVDISAGLGVGLIGSQEPAGHIVRQIVAEAEQLLRQRPAALVRSE
ncbi:MAG: nitronate monooxygenase [Ardenticatenaceae bacterium]|nr:nitronate monooxygenase [Ardenticatenaceae bacterium]